MTVRLNYSKQWTLLIHMVRAAHSIFLSLDMLKMFKKFFFASIGTIQKIVKRKLHTACSIPYDSYGMNHTIVIKCHLKSFLGLTEQML